MKEKKRRVDLTGFIYSSLIESLLVFAIIAIVLLIEFNSRDILTSSVVRPILERALGFSISYIVVFKITKATFFSFLGIVSNFLKGEDRKSLSASDVFTDIFASLLIILTTVPLRPILQKVIYEDGVPIFNQALVRFDAIQSVIILTLAGLPLLFTAHKRFSGTVKNLYIVGIISAIAIAAYINNKPNYDARIYESRADWITRDWEKQGVDAKKALDDAKTSEEKAIAYYWLGVSESRQGNYYKAIQYQLKAVEADPTYGAPHSSLALSYLHYSNDLEKVKYHSEKCIKLSPKYAWCYYAMAAYFDKSGSYADSYKNLNTAIELDPTAVDFQNTLKYLEQAHPDIVE